MTDNRLFNKLIDNEKEPVFDPSLDELKHFYEFFKKNIPMDEIKIEGYSDEDFNLLSYLMNSNNIIEKNFPFSFSNCELREIDGKTGLYATKRLEVNEPITFLANDVFAKTSEGKILNETVMSSMTDLDLLKEAFANSSFLASETIVVASLRIKDRNPMLLGNFINEASNDFSSVQNYEISSSQNENCTPVFLQFVKLFVATKIIEAGEEIKFSFGSNFWINRGVIKLESLNYLSLKGRDIDNELEKLHFLSFISNEEYEHLTTFRTDGLTLFQIKQGENNLGIVLTLKIKVQKKQKIIKGNDLKAKKINQVIYSNFGGNKSCEDLLFKFIDSKIKYGFLA